MSDSSKNDDFTLENGDVVEIKGVHYMMCEGKLFETKYLDGQWCLGEDAVRYLADKATDRQGANKLYAAIERARAEREAAQPLGGRRLQ